MFSELKKLCLTLVIWPVSMSTKDPSFLCQTAAKREVYRVLPRGVAVFGPKLSSNVLNGVYKGGNDLRGPVGVGLTDDNCRLDLDIGRYP